MKKRKLKKSVKISLIVLISLGISLITLSFIYLILTSPTNIGSKKNIEVTIKKGMHTSEIATLLKKKGLIRSEFIFKVEAKLRAKPLKASTYYLKKSMSLRKIVKIVGAAK